LSDIHCKLRLVFGNHVKVIDVFLWVNRSLSRLTIDVAFRMSFSRFTKPERNHPAGRVVAATAAATTSLLLLLALREFTVRTAGLR